ncbi:MAG: DNA gyrase subunit A, partial [Gemmatimonadota bacterium]
SMSVIVQRALPDVRDGLKPVHRRILYAMSELGLAPNRPYKKSATVVGEVLGKYHPHGDNAVYDSLVRMVQDFSLRYPLVDGQGNFGSIDGDNAAAYRYTEARLTSMATELLADLDRETVDVAPNFDDRLTEPTVLPAKVPNLLINGSSGIAVGMSTNIPPHNLREIGAAVRHLVENPDCEMDELLRLVPGPDFPTGGLIVGREGIESAYRTGRGRIVMRARVKREALRGGKEQLVVTEIPYGVSKARIIEQIATLVRSKKVEDITDLRDESDRDGMRLVIELKRGASAAAILERLYRGTYLRATFGAILLALDRGVPREMNLKALLGHFRDHRIEVIQRRSQHDLDAAGHEAHVVEGLLIAVENIDEVISIIRASEDRAGAGRALRDRFELTEIQAEAILDMRLARLTGLETDKLHDRLRDLKRTIRELEAILGSQERQLEVLLEELESAVERYGDARRTEILSEDEEPSVEDALADEEVVVTLSHQGYIKRIPLHLYRRRMGSGKALAGMDRFEDDFLERVFIASTTDSLLVFTRSGQVHALPVHELPEAGRQSRGRSIAQVAGLEGDERVAGLLAVRDFNEHRVLVFLTRGGTVKRTALDQFSNIRAGGINAVSLRGDDQLIDVILSDGTHDLALVTSGGRAIRFPETDVPLMGRSAQGVRGIQLRSGDTVVGVVDVRRRATLCTVTELGHAKRTPIDEYPAQKRGGLGTITLQVSDRTGPLVAAQELLERDELMVICRSGRAIRLGSADIPIQGRNSQGKALAGLAEDDAVARVARVAGRRTEEAGDELEERGSAEGENRVSGDVEPASEPRPEVAMAQAQLELDA